ncbi:S9 family peptidase [Arhodomonas sp. SL1]|uniref:S9 family peptidase n=1 Tax=Arhodomonas sp. SL1 TaxID=3425691 RepID=UPI003F881DC8
MSTRALPWGHWPGTIEATALAQGNRITGFAVSTDGQGLAWTEHRPNDAGRTRLFITASGTPESAWSPTAVGARCRVHEYGGRAVWSGTGDHPWLFIEEADQGVWAVTGRGEATPLHVAEGLRHGDCDVHAAIGRLVCLQEDPAGERTRIVLLDLSGRRSPRILAESDEFCGAPRISTDGRYVAWIAWNAPEMPWTRTRLWLMDLDSGQARALTDGRSSALEPRWGADGSLYCLDDRAGWWQLYRLTGAGPFRVCDDPADLSRPPWQLAQPHHVGRTDGTTLAVRIRQACCDLIRIDPSGQVRPLAAPDVDITQLQWDGQALWYLGAPEDGPRAICRLDAATGRLSRIVGEDLAPDPDAVARPEPITTEGPDGPVHGYLYHPWCPGVSGPRDSRPPLLVRAHGGPTAMRSPAWNPELQFWTGRGIAVAEVNYGGSSGHGRAYRERLRGRWGIADVEDCIRFTQALAARGLFDGRQAFIAGNSAGGLTVLNALRGTTVFAGGLCRWAVTDLARLAALTHRFERGYLGFLVGDPERDAERYAARSPARHAGEITAPVLLIQGDADRVVPVSQATEMADAMAAAGGGAEMRIYPGEGHGLRRAAHIRTAALAELAFVQRHLRGPGAAP